MKTFHCTNCQNLLFFENVRCLQCGETLAYLPDRASISALRQDADGLWRLSARDQRESLYKLCINYSNENVCNWALPHDDPQELCLSCRLTRVIPQLTPENKASWYRLETAKRRLSYCLLARRLPLEPQNPSTPRGVSFAFLADSKGPNGDRGRVLTGHDNGLITINIAEADDIWREQQRLQQNEPYRTLLGHFRHEIGHYYWDRLIAGTPRLEAFRARFGDERADYNNALARHYESGPPADWAENFVSGYATAHPWEDWAESWAHFMHIVDALETAGALGVSLTPRRADEPVLQGSAESVDSVVESFDRMIERWLPLTYMLNNLSRGLGLPDSYPFVLSPSVLEKLRFVRDTVVESATPVGRAALIVPSAQAGPERRIA